MHRDIVAVGLLRQRNLDRLGNSLEHVWPIDQTPCFGAILHAIDEAEKTRSLARTGPAVLRAGLGKEAPVPLITPKPVR